MASSSSDWWGTCDESSRSSSEIVEIVPRDGIQKLYARIIASPKDSVKLIDDHFEFTPDFIGLRDDRFEYFFSILKSFDYTTSIMKAKVQEYLNSIERGDDSEISIALFIPYIIEHSPRCHAVYEENETTGEIEICGYSYEPMISDKVDVLKLKKIRELFNDFFFHRDERSSKDTCLEALKQVVRNDNKPKYVQKWFVK